MDCRNYEPYVPEFENPYPEPAGLDITRFVYCTPLHLCRCKEAVQRRQGGDADYIVSRPYTVRFRYNGVDREIAVPEGMVTDLTSVPGFARIFVGRVGPHLEAAIVHDFLYIAWQDMGERGVRREDRRFADRLIYAAMKAAGVHFFKRWLIYIAVMIFGGIPYARRDGIRYVKDRPDEDS